MALLTKNLHLALDEVDPTRAQTAVAAAWLFADAAEAGCFKLFG